MNLPDSYYRLKSKVIVSARRKAVAGITRAMSLVVSGLVRLRNRVQTAERFKGELEANPELAKELTDYTKVEVVRGLVDAVHSNPERIGEAMTKAKTLKPHYTLLFALNVLRGGNRKVMAAAAGCSFLVQWMENHKDLVVSVQQDKGQALPV